jgi:hypothetical protein
MVFAQGLVRSECLASLLILNQQHLEQVLDVSVANWQWRHKNVRPNPSLP